MGSIVGKSISLHARKRKQESEDVHSGTCASFFSKSGLWPFIVVCLLLAALVLYWAPSLFQSNKVFIELRDLQLAGLYKGAVRNMDGSFDLTVNVPAYVDVVRRLYEQQEMLRNRIREQDPLAVKYKSSYPLTLDSPYVIRSPEVCRDVDTLDVLVIVHTAVGNFQRRSMLRETWANKNLLTNRTLRVAFMMGLTPDVNTQVMIENEQAVHGDIVQGRFKDTYHNLTHKGVLSLRWTQEHCAHAEMILKADDDMFIDPFVLFDIYYKQHRQVSRRIFCHVRAHGTSPIGRNEGYKWRVDDYEFRGYSHYPVDYCNGYVVIISPDLVRGLYHAARATPFFWVDDVYLYGLLPQRVGHVQFVNIQRNMTLQFKAGLDCYKKGACRLLAVCVRDEAELLQLWSMALAQASPDMRSALNQAFLVKS